jgi:hypothetical protein
MPRGTLVVDEKLLRDHKNQINCVYTIHVIISLSMQIPVRFNPRTTQYLVKIQGSMSFQLTASIHLLRYRGKGNIQISRNRSQEGVSEEFRK